MNNNLDNPFYYLENFRFVLIWVQQRYADLLGQEELHFIQTFFELETRSQALLVRMIMRRGDLFRASKLVYPEIGAVADAVQPLVSNEWIVVDPLVDVDQLHGLLTKKEFADALQLHDERGAKKSDLLTLAQSRFPEPRRFSAWCGNANDTLYQVGVTDLCDRYRLMFFGNLYQDWSEFVLADLGIFTYEIVPFPDASRAFQVRADIDIYLHLHACRGHLEEAADLSKVEADVVTVECGNAWLMRRRAKLLFQIGQAYERLDDNAGALRVYAGCNYAGSRSRRIRVLEKLGQLTAAQALAELALALPESAEETQHLARIMPRLQRKLGQPQPRSKAAMMAGRIDLILPRPADGAGVEEAARRHIQQRNAENEAAPVFYVENTLINSLFGLLCWDAVFSPVPGAFFHPFQSGPADLHSAEFRALRSSQFELALAQLGSLQYRDTIRATFAGKSGIQSPFVYWQILNEDLLELALTSIPAEHLAKLFERILDGIAANRSGFPDLIQFWPQQQRYRMIEVKGPGDRLQDNQLRFLDFCQQHQMPVAVCYVEWEAAGE